MYATYDGIGILIRNDLHKGHQIIIIQISVQSEMSISPVTYTNDSLHGVCFLIVLLYPPQTVVVDGYTVFTLSVLQTVCACVRNVLFP